VRCGAADRSETRAAPVRWFPPHAVGRWGRRTVTFVGVVAVVLATAAGAEASLVLRFLPHNVSPGDLVRVRTVGEGDLNAVPNGSQLPVYLVLASRADHITSSQDSALIRVGKLKVDARGNGRLTFRLPRITRGEYAALILCNPCALHSAGRSLLPVSLGPVLHVSSNVAPEPSHVSTTNRWGLFGWIAGVLACGAIAAAFATAAWRRRGLP
jgi:hypothetical protein